MKCFNSGAGKFCVYATIAIVVGMGSSVAYAGSITRDWTWTLTPSGNKSVQVVSLNHGPSQNLVSITKQFTGSVKIGHTFDKYTGDYCGESPGLPTNVSVGFTAGVTGGYDNETISGTVSAGWFGIGGSTTVNTFITLNGNIALSQGGNLTMQKTYGTGTGNISGSNPTVVTVGDGGIISWVAVYTVETEYGIPVPQLDDFSAIVAVNSTLFLDVKLLSKSVVPITYTLPDPVCPEPSTYAMALMGGCCLLMRWYLR